MDVALGAGELGGILDLDEHDEPEVVPHVVLPLDVLLKRHVLVVEGFALQTYLIKKHIFQRCRLSQKMEGLLNVWVFICVFTHHR